MAKQILKVNGNIGQKTRARARANLGVAQANVNLALNLKNKIGVRHGVQGKIGQAKLGYRVRANKNNIGGGITVPILGSHYLGLSSFGLMKGNAQTTSQKYKTTTAQKKTAQKKTAQKKTAQNKTARKNTDKKTARK